MKPRTATFPPFVAPLIAGSLLFAAACGEDAPSTAATEEAAVTRTATAKKPVKAAAKADKRRGEGLSGCANSVYGLRMPKDMRPAGTPSPGVFRFEGSMTSDLLRSFVEEQLVPFPAPEEEPNALLYRRVTLRKPAGGAPADPIAIRLHRRESGSAVDIWLAAAPAPTEKPAASAAAAPYGASAAGSAFGDAPKDASPRYRSPEERKRAEMELLGKISRGEKLSPEDYDNPLMQ